MKRQWGLRPSASSLARSSSVSFKRGAVVDRGLAARELALALQLELLRRLVGGIEPAARLQLLDGRGISGEAVRLADLCRPVEAEPGEILADAAREFFRRPLGVGVVETEHEAPARLPREQTVEQRRADIAGMKPSRRARREADGDAHVESFSRNLLVMG